MRLFGPAWLVMMADMDASSTLGAAETGAVFKYGLVWFLLLLTIPLYFVQEVSGRIGVATGKGFGEIIRENYSKRVAVLLTIPMWLTDMLTYVVEYLGIAIGLSMVGIPPVVSMPMVFLLHIFIVTKRKYIQAEKYLLLTSSVMVVAFVLNLAVRGIKPYTPFYFVPSPEFLYLLAVNVGAVIMPFMLFFQASATAEKVKAISIVKTCEKQEAVSHVRKETFLGALATEGLMVLVEMAVAGIDPSTNFASAKDLENALFAIAGTYSPLIFGIGLTSAGFLALVVISLGSAWGLLEALGVPRDRAFVVYVLESVPALVVSLALPASEMLGLLLNLLVAFVFVLIGPAVVMGLIANNEKVMGELRNTFWQNLAYWSSLAFVVTFGILAVV
ncbi:MAG: natural resistance-associated macrophage protein [Candidatus Aramenus sulfurataquae]|uniref:Divalent metal cation transporter n=2 Tax=Candidatus Aramenus sulfurataquae TaxID=1326980 RepID=W7KKL0_9CREN|nr:MAG: natural resistance-associated macrophage protein [Candidatus Aramenus sulfurataquae]MCL7344547.1 divalent metal cation transporter [Candidatus Aramenus sulfurataquae]